MEYDHRRGELFAQTACLRSRSRKVDIPAHKTKLPTGTSGEADVCMGQNQALVKIKRQGMLRHRYGLLLSWAGQTSGMDAGTRSIHRYSYDAFLYQLVRFQGEYLARWIQRGGITSGAGEPFRGTFSLLAGVRRAISRPQARKGDCPPILKGSVPFSGGV